MQSLNRGKSFVGKVADHAKGKGWFFGSFMDEELLKSDLVEVAWQKIPSVTPSPEDKHFHKESVEINVVIQGEIKLKIDGHQYELTRGGFYAVWPESVVSDVSTNSETELIVVRAPSINDKVVIDNKKEARR